MWDKSYHTKGGKLKEVSKAASTHLQDKKITTLYSRGKEGEMAAIGAISLEDARFTNVVKKPDKSWREEADHSNSI